MQPLRAPGQIARTARLGSTAENNFVFSVLPVRTLSPPDYRELRKSSGAGMSARRQFQRFKPRVAD